jgi:type IV pilus assembly protein PilB
MSVPASMTVPVIRSVEDLERLHFGHAAESEAKLVSTLTESGLVEPEALDRALAYRHANGTSLLQAIDDLGVLDTSHRPAVIASKLGIPVARIEEFTVEPAVLKAIPVQVALKHRVFPLARHDGNLVVVVSDPADLEAVNTITFAVGQRVELVVAPLEDINRLIDRHFLILEEQNLIAEIGDDAREIRPQKPAEEHLHDIEKRAQEKPVVRLVDAIIRRAVRMRASDINIRPTEHGAEVYYRIDGEMVWQRLLTPDLTAPIVCRIKIMAGMNIAERRLPQDGHAGLVEAGQAVDLRVSVIPMVTGESVVIRVLDKSQGLIGLEQLGIAAEDMRRLERILQHSYGIFLVTGPTGSGKSTTLYAVINERLKNNPHIITVEDPVEYHISGVEQIQIKPTIGYTFAEALRHILRHDPDEILIGEMRDFETSEIAIKAALTGHFVMSTLHTNDAASAITRLQDMGLESYLVSSTVVGIMAQRLVRRICSACRTEDTGSAELRDYFGLPAGETFYRGAGCGKCFDTGYKGRAMVGEIIEVTSALREMITRKPGAEEIRTLAIREGMTPLTQNALAMARAGITTLDEVFSVKLE